MRSSVYYPCIYLIFFSIPLGAKTPAGDKFFAEGKLKEAKKDWQAAYELYSKALAEDPSDVLYGIAAARTRIQASYAHVSVARGLRSRGRLEESLAEFEKARSLDGSMPAIDQEIATTREMMQRRAAPEDRGLTPVQQMYKEREERISRIMAPPELVPTVRTPFTLNLYNESSKTFFETLAKLAGLAILFDPEYQPVKVARFETMDATLEESLDQLAMLSKSYWKPLSRNTIFVTNDNPNKRRDFETLVTKVFYLSSVSSAQEVQEIVNVVRSVVDLQRVFPYQAQYAIVAKGEADKILLAEKLISDLDKPRSEVAADILVLEASKTFSRQVTTALASTGLSVPVTFSPRSSIQVNTTSSSSSSSSSTSSSTSSTTATVGLNSLGHLASSDFAITLPGALLQAALSDANTKILQSPQLRAVDSVKATLKIGDRQPTATGSYQAGTSATTVNALVNTQFTYIDVGVNVELLARVHENGEVSMHLELEISNVNGHVNLGGIDEPIIGQRKVVHDVRMKEGEVSLIAGLSSRQETKSVTGIPGLSGIPIVRRLFTGESVERSQGELMIAIIPHILRRPEYNSSNLRGVATGTTANTKLNYSAPEAAK
jgi:general secretion pathway protein D